MKLFKWIDFSGQLIIVLIAIYLFFTNTFYGFVAFYMGLGSWQLWSALIHWKMIGWNHFSHERKLYMHLMAIALAVGLSLILLAYAVFPLTIILLYLFMLYTLILAVIYIVISGHELKKMSENEVRHSLIDLN